MSISKEKTVNSKETLEYGEIYFELMKITAEQNQEKYAEYDRATDTILLTEIKDGSFRQLEVVENFISGEDMALDRVYEKDKDRYKLQIQKCLQSPIHSVFDIRFMIPEVGSRWHRIFLMSVGDENGYVTKFAARVVNIQKQKATHENMQNRAERDSLSGVYNHATYERVCSKLADETDKGLVFIMVDIDNFKRINDTHGHHAGDTVVQYVGNILQAMVKGCGYAGRLGGDEFSVCLFDVFSREKVLDFCEKLKNAVNQNVGTVPFTISLGVTMSEGRKKSFKELYFEADKAVYFAKENGKNQIIFKDEIEKKKQQKFKDAQSEYVLAEEEIALDQKIEYVAIIDPIEKKILYMNEAGRNILGVSLEDVQKMHCHQLFKGCDKKCSACDLHANRVQILEGEEAAGLERYIPDGKFILQSKYTVWKGISARSITFMDMNDSKHMEQCMEAEMESRETLSKCWALIMESNSGEIEYEKILRVLSDYYDAECCAIVTKLGEKYHELFEYHKNSGQGVAEGLRESLKSDMLEKCEILLDDEGYMRPRHIEEVLLENPDLARELHKRFVHNTIGIALRKYGEIIGILLVINPRHYITDYTMLSRLGIFFGTEFVRKMLTDNKAYEEDHDMLTELWNRNFFNKNWKMDEHPAFKYGMGVFTADIFRLKDVNKLLGYTSGNNRIIALAELFRKVFGDYSLFRYDDDQVIAVCHNVSQNQFQKMVDYAKELIEELDFEVSRGYSWKAEPNLYEAINEAEESLAVHRAFLEKENEAAEKLAKKIENDVLDEIREGNFRMFLQPKVSISKEKTIGAEGLIRLYHPEKGYISPALFIPVLEQQNEVHLIDLFILERVFQFQKAARDAGKEVLPISVNFSKNTLMYPKLMEFIKKQCETYGLPNGMIRIEITETISSMEHMEVNNIASELHNMGFAIAMDDFGTQYSNMAVLTQFDFDIVKIDRSMILNIANDPKSKILLKYTVAMLKELGKEIVIEGVETAEQVSILAELGCDIVQGFFFGKPEPEEKFYELYM